MNSPEPPFSITVERCFSLGASTYQRSASLQAAVAARLARLARPLASTLPPGPRADLGAGSGLLARAIESQLGGPSLLRLDACAALLQQEQPPEHGLQRLWDLNQGLPVELDGASLLASSFALQWLEQPEQELSRWRDALHSPTPAGCPGADAARRQRSAAAPLPAAALQPPQPQRQGLPASDQSDWRPGEPCRPPAAG